MLEHPLPRASSDALDAHGAGAFFVAALGFTWSLQLPAVLALFGILEGPVERFMPVAALGAFGPVLAAVLVARFEAGSAGVRQLFRGFRVWRVGAGWYLVALGIFAAIYVAGSAVYRVLGGAEAGRWLYPPENAQHVAGLVMMPLVEEPGWRGFALPRLQRRYGPLTASLLLGLAWGFWHTMMFLVQGVTPFTFAVSIVNIVAGSVIFSWIYNRTRQSLLLAVVAHVGVHLNNPMHSLPSNVAPFVVYTAAICVAACAVVLLDRGAFRAVSAEPS